MASGDIGEEILVIKFGTNGNSDQYVRSGWAQSEDDFRWMVGQDSEMALPPLEQTQCYWFRMSIYPCVEPPMLAQQRFRVAINGIEVHENTYYSGADVSLEVDGQLLSNVTENIIHFVHPDAASPSHLIGGNDSRLLAFRIEKVVLSKKAVGPNHRCHKAKRPMATSRSAQTIPLSRVGTRSTLSRQEPARGSTRERRSQLVSRSDAEFVRKLYIDLLIKCISNVIYGDPSNLLNRVSP